ncbi:hypothetical protein CMV_002871 [Castanea mollissima]|uniref:Uncharacterized protein n=1 Tax=Castanea mollissima TaxID=60419 RepID=A0A8J4VVR2_9ROSI|nr:hypothetical protein CMV_002871 [Castanea mollissima]
MFSEFKSYEAFFYGLCDAPSFDISRQVRNGHGSDGLQIHEWVTGEGSGTHEDEEGEIPSSGVGLGSSPADDTKSDEEPRTHKEEAGEFQSSGQRMSCPLVTVTKPDNCVSGSDDHGTVVEAVLSADRKPAHSPVVADQTVDQGAGFLVAETSFGARSTTAENSECPAQVQSQLVVGSDLNFPIFEVGCGFFESEVPRLIWDDSLPSGKGEEDVNPEVITALALWDPNGFPDLVFVEDGEDGLLVEEVLEPSEWVRRMIRGFSTFVGFPIDCCERQCIIFFKNLSVFGSSKRLLLLLVR